MVCYPPENTAQDLASPLEKANHQHTGSEPVETEEGLVETGVISFVRWIFVRWAPWLGWREQFPSDLPLD